MSEYWKSTPKYWCKFCSEYVKDTKFERQQHEATGRHQGSIQRSLRGLHREQEQQARQKQRAKDEVARLNGLVPGASNATAAGGAPIAGTKPTFVKTDEKKATLSDRKRQWEQLAAMGIAAPDEARADMALKGEWQTVSEQVVGEVGDDGEFKPVLNKGVRKRILDEDEEEKLAAGELITKRKGWGETYKRLPKRGGDDDLDALFGKKEPVAEEAAAEAKTEMKEEDVVKSEDAPSSLQNIPTEEEAAAGNVTSSTIANALVKEEDNKPGPAVVFKKRKKTAK